MVTSSTVVLTTETDRRRVRQADGEKKRKREGDGEGEIERGSRKEQTECYRLHSPFITLAHTSSKNCLPFDMRYLFGTHLQLYLKVGSVRFIYFYLLSTFWAHNFLDFYRNSISSSNIVNKANIIDKAKLNFSYR